MARPLAGRASAGPTAVTSVPPDQGCGSLLDIAADHIEHQIDTADVFQDIVREVPLHPVIRILCRLTAMRSSKHLRTERRSAANHVDTGALSRMATSSGSYKVVYAALAGNLMIALTKFGAAWWTGSSVMLSEGVHSLVDTGNQSLLLYGLHRASLPPDDDHPLGHGRELYLWSFVVAVLMFTFGAGVTLLEGARHIYQPNVITDARISYMVLGASFVFEAITWGIALREFARTKGDLGYVEAIRASKNPPNFLVILEDSAALSGIFIAAAATFAAEHFQLPQLDGLGSIGIAVVLAVVAFISARESKGLLLGEPARRRVRQSILSIANNQPNVERADLVFTVHLGPDQILVALSVEFSDALATSDIESNISEIENKIQQRHQEVIAVFIKPQTVARFRGYRDRIRAQMR